MSSKEIKCQSLKFYGNSIKQSVTLKTDPEIKDGTEIELILPGALPTGFEKKMLVIDSKGVISYADIPKPQPPAPAQAQPQVQAQPQP